MTTSRRDQPRPLWARPSNPWSALLLLGLISFASQAGATTYYVDPYVGSDDWAGTSHTANATNGPWATLAKVSSATLKPGDSVLLKCGAKWRTPLTVSASGAPGNPIVIGSYPEPDCSDKPEIDGGIPLPAQGWSKDSGFVFKSKFPPQFIANSSFESGLAGWKTWSSSGDATLSTSNSCSSSTSPCVSFSAKRKPALLISNTFPVSAGERYTISLRIQLPTGARAAVIARQNGPRYDPVGSVFSRVVGTGSWQTVTHTFTSTRTVANARVDIEIPENTTALIDDVALAFAVPEGTPVALLSNNLLLFPAHHPNIGHDSTRPNSPYLQATMTSPTVTLANGKKVSQYINTSAASLKLPTGAQLAAGLGIALRSQGWSISTHTITSVSGTRIYIEPASAYPLSFSGWGFQLTGARWMLDSGGEWFYDATSQQLYVWMPDSTSPGQRVTASSMATAINASRRSYISINNISIRAANTGIDITGSTSALIANVSMENITEFGVSGNSSESSAVTDSVFDRIGSDAIHARDSKFFSAIGNTITQSGVSLSSDRSIVGNPTPAYAAILVGLNATVTDNAVRDAGNNGIAVSENSTVRDNAVAGFCLALNDCGGVYSNTASNVTIERNLVTDGTGNLDGVPAAVRTTHAVAIYMDGGTTNSNILGNAVATSDWGLQLHNASKVTVSGNLFAGNRRSELFNQETSKANRADGDTYGNAVTRNAFFPFNATPSITQSTKTENTADFATFAENRYSTLYSSWIATETWPGTTSWYTLSDWMAAKSPSGTDRLLDVGASIGAPLAFVAPGRYGSNMIANADFGSGLAGWSSYSAALPNATMSVVPCEAPQTAAKCIQLDAGGGTSMLSSPRFSVIQGNNYRVSFDAKVVSNATSKPSIVVRRAGPTSYASLIGEAITPPVSSSWKRYTFMITPLASVQNDDPVTGDRGARFDIDGIRPGESLWIANLAVVPMQTTGVPIRTAFLSNPERAQNDFDCPFVGGDVAACASSFDFVTGEKIVWPLVLPQFGSKALFSIDESLRDEDSDGIEDQADACPGTTAGEASNERGCALGQP